jgi:hypothetical protein
MHSDSKYKCVDVIFKSSHEWKIKQVHYKKHKINV